MDKRPPGASGSRVFVISGPSGGGKTTLIARLRRMMPRIVRSVSVTTRPRRSGERAGRDYHFVSPERFRDLKQAGRLLEWARVHDAHYGTLKRPVLEALAQGRHVIVSVDVQGARKIRQALGARAVLIFLLPPSFQQLRQRLVRRRTDTVAAIRARLAAAKRELACARWYDHAVVNEQLDTAVSAVSKIIRSSGRAEARHRRSDSHGTSAD